MLELAVTTDIVAEMAPVGAPKTRDLYYITHIRNLTSILEHGILSHASVEARGLTPALIYDAEIVSARKARLVPDGRSLWEFANLYFQPRNAMLFRVVAEKGCESIAVLAVKNTELNREDILIATGNAASDDSEILRAEEGRARLPEIRKDLDREYWAIEDGSKRKMMAECLVPDRVPPEKIVAIYVGSHEVADLVKAAVSRDSVHVIPDLHMFFRPSYKSDLTRNLSLVSGDMFFSRLQTLTVSVNCVGVMGKGLASRAKYQFPDVYVKYQDVCRSKQLRMGQPFLYKRERSYEVELADHPSSFRNGNGNTWFLLFPTKGHWKEDSDIRGIEAGLLQVTRSWQHDRIRSLALPALGCGLGRLNWRDVGPLMCRFLCELPIPVWIYLPAERKVPEEQLTREFLLPAGV